MALNEYRIHHLEIESDPPFQVDSIEKYQHLMSVIMRTTELCIIEDPYNLHWVVWRTDEPGND